MKAKRTRQSEMIRKNLDEGAAELADLFEAQLSKTPPMERQKRFASFVARVAKIRERLSRPESQPVAPQSLLERVKSGPEAIHHPSHYNQGDIEHCEMIEDQGLADGYYPGQVTKYIFRAGRKPRVDGLQDLQKAQWYMARWLAWRTHGKKLWKIARREPEMVFDPTQNALPNIMNNVVAQGVIDTAHPRRRR